MPINLCANIPEANIPLCQIADTPVPTPRTTTTRTRGKIHQKQWPPSFAPAAMGSGRTPLGPKYQTIKRKS